ncbi:MAG TPA: glycosyltransferase, partial [Planctomycetota bacterium]|nr:glycosyltransferase [Planctomycetota bacterium]
RDALRNGADLVMAYSSCMAQFVEDAPVPRVMEFGDLDSEKWAQYAQDTHGIQRLVYRREARTLLEYERSIARSFDVSLVVSPAEASVFEQRTGVRPRVVGNGVDLERFRPDPSVPREPGLVVFTGIMDYRPNVDGCERFATRVLPRVRARVPGARFRIVGARPTASIQALAGDGIEVTGFVPDTADHLRRASVAIAPLRLGRGLQNKILEAMACGTPLVATTNATAGVDASPEEHFRVADTAEAFADAVIELLLDPARASALAARARARVAERYPWERALEEYDRAIDEAVERHAARATAC